MPVKGSYIDFIPQSTAPSAVEGRIYYDSTVKRLKFYNGTQWVQL